MASFATVSLMPPPYLLELPWTAVPELGSIIIWRPHAASAASDVLDLYLSAPWCSLCIVCDDVGRQVLSAVVDTVMPLPCLPVVVHPGDSIVAAIRKRRPPSQGEAVRVIRHRAQSPEFGLAMSALLDDESSPAQHRQLRRLFGRHSRFGPRHWQTVLRLTGLKLKADESPEAIAGRYEADVRTLRRHVETCLGVPFERFRKLVGWEWRVEAALRRDINQTEARYGTHRSVSMRQPTIRNVAAEGGDDARGTTELTAVQPRNCNSVNGTEKA